MRKSLTAGLFVVAVFSFTLLVSVTGCAWPRAEGAQKGDTHVVADLPERDEVHQSYQLAPGAQITLSHVNGHVDVQTVEGDTAYVDIVRSAHRRSDFVYDTISIQHSPSELTLRGADSKSGRIEVRQRVSLRIPRQSSFKVRQVNGPVNIGPVEGRVNVRGVNGTLRLAHAAASSEISSVNGHMTLTVSRIGDGGLSIRDAISPVELRLADDVNANLTVRELDGRVSVNSPAVTINRLGESEYNGRVGAGGAPISIVDVRGGLRIGRTQ
jgi:hypothetical protein